MAVIKPTAAGVAAAKKAALKTPISQTIQPTNKGIAVAKAAQKKKKY